MLVTVSAATIDRIDLRLPRRLSRLIDPALRIDHLRSFSGTFQFQLS
ncbi:hypothetical protein ACVISU_005067 [Bradyrhizobium sp. USDA 4452]